MKKKQKPYPPTPELDKMKAVQEKSQAVGEFLDVFLRERGYTLCTFRKAGNNGEPFRRWKKGVKTATLDGCLTSSREPTLADVYNRDAEDNPSRESWPDEYLPANQNIEKTAGGVFRD